MWLVVVGAAAILLAVLHFATTVPFITLHGLEAFAEPEPFQRRALGPALAAGLGAVMGTGTPTFRFLLVEVAAWMGVIAAARWALAEYRPDLVARLRRWAAVSVALPVGIQLMLPARFRVFEGDVAVGDITALSGAATSIRALPGLYFPYDVPSAALLLALIASASGLARRPSPAWWAVHVGLLMAAAANRETAMLVVPFTVWLWSRRLGWRTALGRGLAQAAVVGGVVLALGAVIGAPANPRSPHPGGAEWFLWTNLRTLAHPSYLLTSLAPLAAGLWIVPLARWSRMPAVARGLVVWYVCPALGAALIWGSALETRVFTESAAALWLAAAIALLPGTDAVTAPPRP